MPTTAGEVEGLPWLAVAWQKRLSGFVPLWVSNDPAQTLSKNVTTAVLFRRANSVAVILDKKTPYRVRRERRVIAWGRTKPSSSIFSLVVASVWSAVLPTNAQVNVTQHHNHASRDGLYIDSAFTLSAAANLARDLNFNGTISGNVYAQPLYIEGGPGG